MLLRVVNQVSLERASLLTALALSGSSAEP
jgi:hypothetical protein